MLLRGAACPPPRVRCRRYLIATVAVTGIAGYLGQGLLGRLAADEAVERVVGIDIADPLAGSPGLEFHGCDIRDPRLAKIIGGADVVVHLAFALNPMRDEGQVRSVNVDGTRNVLDAAAAAGVRAVVVASSGVVYGAHPDNDFPLAETSPLRANPQFAYAAHKRAVEDLTAAFRVANPRVRVAILRPAIILGRDAENFISRQLEGPVLLTVRGYEPPFQMIHQDDAAAAFHFAVREDLDGAFNVAADGWLSVPEMIGLTGKRRIQLTPGAAARLAERLWRAGLTLFPPGELPYLMHPWVLDNSRLKEAGWRPRRSNRETLLETMQARRGWVSFGPARVQRESLARAAGAFAAAAGGVAAWRRIRRSRR